MNQSVGLEVLNHTTNGTTHKETVRRKLQAQRRNLYEHVGDNSKE